jgi:hypothetical protein
MVNKTVVTARHLGFSFVPIYTQTYGCGLVVRHALECKTGGNVISRHNEIRDEVADLASKAIVPSAVTNH